MWSQNRAALRARFRLYLGVSGPQGKPRDPSSVLPRLDQGPRAIDLVNAPKRLPVHSLGGDCGVNDAELRQALPARGSLTVGMPTTVEPMNPIPSPEEVVDILNGSGVHRIRTP